MISLPAQCLACRRLDRSTPMAGQAPGVIRPVVNVCTAYPTGIPAAIAMSGVDHRRPFDGDNGLMFQQLDTPEALTAFSNWRRVYLNTP